MARLFGVTLVANVRSYLGLFIDWGESKACLYGLMQEKMLRKIVS